MSNYQQGWHPGDNPQQYAPQQGYQQQQYQQQYGQQQYQQYQQYGAQPPYQQQQYQQPPYQNYQPVMQNVTVNVTASAGTAGSGQSYFDGGLLQQIGWTILGALITLFTFGLGLPWAICKIYDWETSHTVIEGRRLAFDGTPLQLFGLWIKWYFLTIITLGIYAFWVKISLKKWITKHTYFES